MIERGTSDLAEQSPEPTAEDRAEPVAELTFLKSGRLIVMIGFPWSVLKMYAK